MVRVRLEEFREDVEEPQRRAVPHQDVPREVPSGLIQRDDDDYDYSKIEMDVDDDSEDHHSNDAGKGFLGPIVPDEDDDVSNMHLAQFGGIPFEKTIQDLRSQFATNIT